MAALTPRRAVAYTAILGLVVSCNFFDPLDQGGFGLVMLPLDTAVYVGNTYQAHAMMLNQFGDVYSSSHLRYGGLDATVSVSDNGAVSGVAYGRGRVVVSRDRLADTGWVSVVPPGRLALSSGSHVDVMNVDGSQFQSVAITGQGDGGAAAWLPGDAGVVFHYGVPGAAGTTSLVIADLAGNSRLFVQAGRDPRVSRDGSWIYFGYGGQISRIHPDGSGLDLVTAAGDYQPDPSPDGMKLVYIRSRTAPPFGFQVVIRTLQDGTEQVIDAELQPQWPRWSPAGDSIAYWTNGKLFLMGVDGTGARQVSPPARPIQSAGFDWSPDGQWIVARSDSTVDLMHVATGFVLPLPYTKASGYRGAAWRW